MYFDMYSGELNESVVKLLSWSDHFGQFRFGLKCFGSPVVSRFYDGTDATKSLQ